MNQQQQDVNRRFAEGTSSVNAEDVDKVIGKESKVFALFQKLGSHAQDFKLLWDLLKDYKNGEYSAVPWKLIAAIVFAFLYLVSPIDAIPDFIPVLGLTDDISVFGLVLAGFGAEIEAYKTWRNSQNALLCESVGGEEEK